MLEQTPSEDSTAVKNEGSAAAAAIIRNLVASCDASEERTSRHIQTVRNTKEVISHISDCQALNLQSSV